MLRRAASSQEVGQEAKSSGQHHARSSASMLTLTSEAKSKLVINAGTVVLANPTEVASPAATATDVLTFTGADVSGVPFTSLSTLGVPLASPTATLESQQTLGAGQQGGQGQSDWLLRPHVSFYLGISACGIVVLALVMTFVGICIYRRGVKKLELRALELKAGIENLDRQNRRDGQGGATPSNTASGEKQDSEEYSSSLQRKGSMWPFRTTKKRSNHLPRRSHNSVPGNGKLQGLISPFETPIMPLQSSSGNTVNSNSSSSPGMSLWSRLPGTGKRNHNKEASSVASSSGARSLGYRYSASDCSGLPTTVSLPSTPRFADWKVDLYNDEHSALPTSNSGSNQSRDIYRTDRRSLIRAQSKQPHSPWLGSASPMADSPLLPAPSPSELPFSPDLERGLPTTTPNPYSSFIFPRFYQPLAQQSPNLMQSNLSEAGTSISESRSNLSFRGDLVLTVSHTEHSGAASLTQIHLSRPPLERMMSSEETLVGSGSYHSVGSPQGLGVSLPEDSSSSFMEEAARRSDEGSLTANTVQEWQTNAEREYIPRSLDSKDNLVAISASSSETSSPPPTPSRSAREVIPSKDQSSADACAIESSLQKSDATVCVEHVNAPKLVKTVLHSVSPTRARINNVVPRENDRKTMHRLEEMDEREAIEEALRLVTLLMATSYRNQPRRKRANTLPSQQQPLVPVIKNRPRRGTESQAPDAVLHSVRQQLLLIGDSSPSSSKLATVLDGGPNAFGQIERKNGRWRASSVRTPTRTVRFSNRPMSARQSCAPSTASVYSVASRPHSLAFQDRSFASRSRSMLPSTLPVDAVSALHDFLGMTIKAGPDESLADDVSDRMSSANGSEGVRFEAVTLPSDAHPGHMSMSGPKKAASAVRALTYHLPQRLSARPAFRFSTAQAPSTPTRTSTSSGEKSSTQGTSDGLGLLLDDYATSDEENLDVSRRLVYRPTSGARDSLLMNRSGGWHDRCSSELISQQDSWAFFANSQTPSKAPSRSSTLRSGSDRQAREDQPQRGRSLSSPSDSTYPKRLNSQDSQFTNASDWPMEPLSNSASTVASPDSLETDYMPVRYPNMKTRGKEHVLVDRMARATYYSPTMLVLAEY